jgi:intein/homing endonuclease
MKPSNQPPTTNGQPPVIKWVPPKSEKPKIDNLQKAIQEKKLSPVEIIAPDQIEVDFDYIKIGNVYLRTLFIGGYPRYVTAGWLEPIINFNASMDIAFYIYPVEGKSVLDDLRRKIAEMEAEIETDIERGKIVNPSTVAKLEDAKALQEQLVKGIERFFEFSFYITIPAASVEELNNLSRQIESSLGALLIIAKRASLDMEKGFLSTAPFGVDRLAITRNMDTTSLATTFPFTSAELSSDTGVLYGINPQNDSFIIFDRFSLENSNMTIFATSGAGKSIRFEEPVLFDDGSGPKLKKIGQLVENIISKNNLVQIDDESQGVINPKIKVFTFNKNLKGTWSNVEIAARKISPENLYKITTQSGRETTVTGDHCLITLEDGAVKTTKGKEAKVGDYIPLPRKINKPDRSISPKISIPLNKKLLTLLGLITSNIHIKKGSLLPSDANPKILKTIQNYAKPLGLKASPENKRVPTLVFSLSNKQISYYLRAYFEGNGKVGNHEITATTKSKDLASDLSYLLLHFGIIARIKEKMKATTNTLSKAKGKYYKISISGQGNIQKFIKNISFITEEKNKKAQKLLKKANTNIDIIPEIENIFKDIYKELYNSGIPVPKKFSEIKREIFKSSPQNLLKIIAKIEKRIQEFKFPKTDEPPTLNKLKNIKAKQPLKLKSALKLKEIEKKLNWLKILASSDLFWDKIVKIQKIKSKHEYVYDLQVENAVFLGGHGGMFIHNSYFVKLESLRSLMLGTDILILDPENEYKTLAEAVGGEFITFSFSSPSKINPFDLSSVYDPTESTLGLKILSLHSLFKIIMGELTATQEAMLDRAIIMTYKAKGITQDPETQTKEPPLMEDLYKTLIGMEVPDALDMAARIEKFVKGSFVGIFDQQTNVDITNPFTVFSVRDLQDALRPIAMFIILDFIWTKVKKDLKRRLLVVDEAWHMMRYADSAQFLWSIVKRARKYYLGITTITQDVEDFLAQDIGKAVVTNSALRVLFKQSPAAIDRISEIFYLSQGERQLLLAANVGEGIFFAGPHHAPIRVVSSPEEHKLITSKPEELLRARTSSSKSAEIATMSKQFTENTNVRIETK